MQKPLILLSALLICIAAVAFRSATWIPFAIDERLSVQMPSVPKEVNTATGKAYICESPTANYVVMRTPTSKAFTGSERGEFYNTIVKTFAQEGKGEISGQSSFDIEGHPGTEFVVKLVHPNTGRTGIICVRCLLIDKVAYVFQYLPVDSSKSSKAYRAPFFTSIVLKPSSTSVK